MRLLEGVFYKMRKSGINSLDEKFVFLRKKNIDNPAALLIVERLYNEAKQRIVNPDFRVIEL